MELITDRLILRPWKESDAESLFTYAKDFDVGPVAGRPIHTNVESCLKIIRTILSVDEIYAVCLKDNSVAIGSIGFSSYAESAISVKNDEMEIGYWIGIPFWGNGIILEAARALQKHAFEDLYCTSVWCAYFILPYAHYFI